MFQLNYRDTRPFYEQIKDNLRQLLITHSIHENEKLPSVRELASTLTINPNTIQRAYRELENEGYIYTVPGKGTFASSANSSSQTKRQKDLLTRFDDLVAELLFLSVPVSDLCDHVLRTAERRGNS
ncbi:HTH-type transcriptional regulatory protein gabR [uncultured Roseburia sp.]|uniref:GntR family transcriptional regulator n=1 Tax=Brotonthovivens ammoniilytica TaxID=2981725 RepID=A0ABT2TK56_9FIRM|nr:GntR family transcriptional regulator [Brotonthovivens ammoniilytica]MCU6762588.1 GntR family transcriptional regulator [Brotonthovivens ammoniilytica]SCI76546.1 HTH-type transcriptional regulatory protein gabR [uncultured Roseburia sp.]